MTVARPGFAEAPPQSLPLQLTSFIGREREISEVQQKLAASRLVTLTGPGGCGKTRLALEVAARLYAARAFEHGLAWVELAALSDPALLPQAAARVLEVAESLDRPWMETLSAYLQPRHLLLILDNCEHLRSACAELAGKLLLTAPGLKILATSREPLAVPGETAWLTPSLSLPSPQELARPPAELLTYLPQFDAIRLFLERAVSVRSTFALTTRSAAAVAQVCRRLDGIPLAIELAAARVNVLTAEQIAARLEDSFALLTDGSRSTLMPRHQTLRAALDWSHNLLSEAERRLFRRLAVFAGGFALEAAEAICSGDGLIRAEVLEVLSRLVGKSLVMADIEGGTEARYRLLEAIRQYASWMLGGSGEEALLHRRHRDWFLALAEQADAQWYGPNQIAWSDRLETEHDNLRAALEWSKLEALGSEVEAPLGAGEGAAKTKPVGAQAGLRLGAALRLFWDMRGYLQEGRERMVELLALPGASGLKEARARTRHGGISGLSARRSGRGTFSLGGGSLAGERTRRSARPGLRA